MGLKNVMVYLRMIMNGECEKTRYKAVNKIKSTGISITDKVKSGYFYVF
jgi:hypothetical protein